VEENLKSQLEVRLGGDPDDEAIVFTDRTPVQLEEQMQAFQTPISDDTIREWLKEQKIRLRKIQKSQVGGSTLDRDAQFHNIADQIDTYQNGWQPCVFGGHEELIA